MYSVYKKRQLAHNIHEYSQNSILFQIFNIFLQLFILLSHVGPTLFKVKLFSLNVKQRNQMQMSSNKFQKKKPHSCLVFLRLNLPMAILVYGSTAMPILDWLAIKLS